MKAAIFGLHGPADPARWAWDAGGLDTVSRSGVKAVKLLTGDGIDGKLIDDLRRRGVIHFLARLYFPVNGGFVAPDDFVHSVWNSTMALYTAGVRLFEVHNEANIKKEGCGTQWKTPEDHALWYNSVVAQLRPEMPDALFGMGGLSPGPADEGEGWKRVYSEDDFFSRAFPLLNDCQWIGAHRYWSWDGMEGAMREAVNISSWAKRQPLPVYVTEFSNTAEDYDKAQKAREYLHFWDYCDGVVAIFSFVESSSGAFQAEVWRGSAIPEIIAAGLVNEV